MFIINIKMWVVNEIKDTLSSKFEMKDLGEVVLWTGLVRGKARKPGYNQAGKYKTRQDKIRQY
jgi:hypothetical protein